MRELRIQYLYFADCPSHEEGLARLRKVLAERAAVPEIEIIEVRTEAQARRLKFIGSPTIRIDGRDIDPGGLMGENYALTCRIYHLPEGRFSPLPSEQMIREALGAATS